MTKTTDDYAREEQKWDVTLWNVPGIWYRGGSLTGVWAPGFGGFTSTYYLTMAAKDMTAERRAAALRENIEHIRDLINAEPDSAGDAFWKE